MENDIKMEEVKQTGINWLVRIKNKAFWVAIVPAVAILVQQVMAIFGLQYDFTMLVNQIIAVIDTVFMILVILGIVVDPTTKGVSDSERALQYDDPA